MKLTFSFCICIMCCITSSLNAQRTNAVNYADTRLSNLTSPVAINASLLVDKDNAHNIGSAINTWRNLYLDSAVYLKGVKFISVQSGTGAANTAIGSNVLYANKSGSYNTGLGYNALYSNDNGSSNIGIGYKALFANTSGYENVAIGTSTLFSNTSGYDNVAVGRHAMYFNATGNYNTAMGTQALGYNNSAYNTATGYRALYNNTTGADNTANGASALSTNTTGDANTANGVGALRYNTTGSNNAAYGFGTGGLVTSGDNNTFIGAYSDCGSNGNLTNSMALGYNATVTTSNHVVVGNSSVTSIGGYVNWSVLSDGRVKKNINQNVPGLAFINILQPITYNLDLDAADKIIDRTQTKDKEGKIIQPTQSETDARKIKEQVLYTGFIAQDVEKAAHSLHYDFNGVDKPDNENTLYGLRYSDFVAPLVKAVQELSKKNNELEQRLEKLEAIINSNQSLTDQPSSILSSALLSQNIPNPFNSSTTINYSLPPSRNNVTSARIIITDKNGNALKQFNLLNNKGSITVDASTLASGAYEYNLYIDGKLIAVKQMVLQR